MFTLSPASNNSFINHSQPSIQYLVRFRTSALLFTMGVREMLQRMGLKEKNADNKPMQVDEVRTDVFRGVKNDRHAFHPARVYRASDGSALTVEAKRHGTQLQCQVTPGDKYRSDPSARYETIGTSSRTWGHIVHSGMRTRKM
jgi:hypothetical protein